MADPDELSSESPVGRDIEDARDAIQYQFGLEILVRHDELRLINQELAKCQVALEQLRRCHLIPYPVSCPTPAQMLEISSGKGPALQSRKGEPVPRWAAPFGVVEGPYARHYAKWLIPDPMFDGMIPEPMSLRYDASRAKSAAAAAAEGRTTRNSFADVSSFGSKGRPMRGLAGQKLHALSSGYPQPKEKQGPCILKRSDGKTVKLVCIDCQRWDFSSTQGFINHCRIAHRRDFKSHEEAAVHSGHPIEVDEAGGTAPADSKPASATTPVAAAAAAVPAVPTGLVHPLARIEPVTDQQAYAALRSRISASMDLYKAGKLPNVKSIPGAPTTKPSSAKPKSTFVAAASTPFLSSLLQKKNFQGNLRDQVEDAKTKMDMDEVFTPGDESDDPDLPSNLDGASAAAKPAPAPPAARVPSVMRVPARTVVSPVPIPTIPARPTSSKGRAAPLALNVVPEEKEVEPRVYDDDDMDMDMDLSPHTIASNNAPSLVSDDGEYDDSDDGSSSDTSESMETESVSDVAEISIGEEPEVQDHDAPRHHHHRSGSGTTVKLRKEEAKHVTFVSPIPGKAKGTRKQKV
jgi:ADA HAT complex component 1